MGESSNSLISDVLDRRGQVFEGFKEHFNSKQVSTELVLLELLRKTHPGFHVTCVSSSKCDLLGYAKAGHATTTIDESDESFDATRSYNVDSRRLDGSKPGELNDHVRFGRLQYKWGKNEYLLYEIEYPRQSWGTARVHFVLSALEQLSTRSRYHPATDALLRAAGAWTAELHNEIWVFDDSSWEKSEELWESVQGASWDDVILHPEMKANLIRDVQGFFQSRAMYEKLGVPWKRGVIIHGEPGNGKTISIKALINVLSALDEPVPALYVKTFVSAQHNTQYAIRKIFTHAREMAPCLIIFEDLDSLINDKCRNYFLNEVDGLESNDGILMIGSTNHLDQLDSSISKRPSRFDRKYHFRLPDEEARIAYCKFWRRKVAGNDMVDFPEELCTVIAKLTVDFSFAYLKELFLMVFLAIAHDAEQDYSSKQMKLAESSSASTESLAFVTPEGEYIKEAGAHNGKTKSAEAGKKRTHRPVVLPKLADLVKFKCVRSRKNKSVPKAVPNVKVPVHLKDNALLRVVRQQLPLLIKDMNSSSTVAIVD